MNPGSLLSLSQKVFTDPYLDPHQFLPLPNFFFNIFLPSTSWFSKWSVTHRYPVCPFPLTTRATSFAHPNILDLIPRNICLSQRSLCSLFHSPLFSCKMPSSAPYSPTPQSCVFPSVCCYRNSCGLWFAFRLCRHYKLFTQHCR